MHRFFLVIISTFRFFQPWLNLVLFYLIIMEMTLLIFGYSFNFSLLSQEQFTCRKKVDQCLHSYIYYGINDEKKCTSDCLDALIITLEDYHKYNFFTRLIDRFIDEK